MEDMKYKVYLNYTYKFDNAHSEFSMSFAAPFFVNLSSRILNHKSLIHNYL